ncbi:MAG: ribosome recycling factor [Selenomonadaceae bacterium]|nr:ribosome recycling factor [Selenomonadaceae bacterium]
MTKDIINASEDKLKKSLESLKKDYGTLRAGRAAPSLLDKVMVDYYGTPTPVNQMANVTVPEPRMLMIKPYDKGSLKEIERAIQKSDLGLTPNSDGIAIRLAIPQPTQERRKELVKVVNKKAEDCKVAMRNIRRDANEAIKKLEKGKEITEDDRKEAQEKIQKLLDKYIKLVDSTKATKEKEVMEV